VKAQSLAQALATERPGLAPPRLLRLARDAIEECRLDLAGAVVLTEAASGPYVVTPVVAAIAGAEHVIAWSKDTRYGSFADVAEATRTLARLAGVEDVITITDKREPDAVGHADIITNSGHVRPIDSRMIEWMKPGAVVPLMFEGWELDSARGDLDVEALRARGIAFAGTNERHPAVRVFDYLGLLAARLLLDAAFAVKGCRVGVLCDNPFEPYLTAGLEGAGATVAVARRVDDLVGQPGDLEALLVAMTPRGASVISGADVRALAERWPDVVVAQFWGDVDRAELRRAGVPYWPIQPPPPGHMAILLSALGPDPVVRLQAGGLKVGSVLLTPQAQRASFDLEFLDAV
jgi:hypothetical protein